MTARSGEVAPANDRRSRNAVLTPAPDHNCFGQVIQPETPFFAHNSQTALGDERRQAMAGTIQALMRHESHQTTQRYIALARQMEEAVQSPHVPEMLKAQQG